jgi:GTPase
MNTSAPAAQALVAIVGRANVGKSTLFNSLTRSSQALVADVPGVTRDRHFGRVVRDDRAFLLADTGGLVGGEDDLGPLVQRQAQAAVADADVILLVMDGKVGPQPGDEEVVDYLRATGKPLFLVVNKIDHPAREDRLADFYRFGLSPLYPVSAAHKLGLSALLDDVLQSLPQFPELPEETVGIRVAVVGRPNVGKSSFINRVLGEERLIVSDRPGTTRDVIDAPLTFQGQDYVLIDTAGLRRPSLVAPGLEKYMVLKVFKALERCDLALLLLDAQEGVTAQDLRIARLIAEEGKGCVMGLNKWDLVPAEVRPAALDQARKNLDFLSYAPLVSLSVHRPQPHPDFLSDPGRLSANGPAGGHRRAQSAFCPPDPAGAPSPVPAPAGEILLPHPGGDPSPHLYCLCEPSRGGAGYLSALLGERTAQRPEPDPGPHPPVPQKTLPARPRPQVGFSVFCFLFSVICGFGKIQQG